MGGKPEMPDIEGIPLSLKPESAKARDRQARER
jgi:hypothetical protein